MAGGFKSGRLLEVSVATKLLSTYVDTADIDFKIENGDVTAGTAAFRSYISGLAGVTLTLAGSWDPTVTVGPQSVLLAQIALNQGGTATAVIFWPAGQAASSGTSHTFNALLSSYKESSKVSGPVTFTCSLLCTGVDAIAQT